MFGSVESGMDAISLSSAVLVMSIFIIFYCAKGGNATTQEENLEDPPPELPVEPPAPNPEETKNEPG
ncbi:hypothetical protein EB796_015409 [Bugula neritina]|uniref:Uncharacterized protein n=1 Tax=Bugula neritina TaxID=10212 RepID=A0A7J7JKX6_BUGNE|nr:hypothetical protein EB796_015409 [Bugula neritina]